MEAEIRESLYRVDLEPGGFSNLVSVYVADGGRGLAVFEGGPAVTSVDLASALRSFGKPVEAVFLTHVHIDHYGGDSVSQTQRGLSKFVETRAHGLQLSLAYVVVSWD